MSDFFKEELPGQPELSLSKEEKNVLLQYNNLNKKNKRIILILLNELQD